MATRNYKVGNFTEMVLFLKPERRISETGASETVYVEAAKRLCEVQDRLAASEVISDAMSEVQTYSVVTWMVKEITTEWRAEYKGDRYYIVRTINEQRGISRYELRREDLCNE